MGGIAPQHLAVVDEVLTRVEPFYAGRRVAVTGGMSFIGSHLVEALVTTGASVVVADDLSSGREDNLATVRDRVEFLHGDLRDADVARESCRDVDVLFQLAAMHGGRGYIDTHPVECLNNMSLDHTMLAAAAEAGVQKIIYASSACVYPVHLQTDAADRLLLSEGDANFDEVGKAFPDGEYGWYKLTGELQLRAFHRQFGVDGVACRIFTAYGERENESHAAIALIAKAVARMDPYPIWGNGTQTRNFTYVGDTAAGLLLAGARMAGFDVVNVGTPEHHTIDELIDVIFDLVGWRPSRIDRQLEKPVGVRSRAADVSRSRQLLGWTPTYSVAVGVERTLRWYESAVTAERLASLESLLMER
ncbi:MAG: NAD-dependent epimerase/dehydratase family protein [Actinomycetota bacterium]|nr:NAD-dependent epimerase/dehydratase family protein [Actinomycetota bacterium]